TRQIAVEVDQWSELALAVRVDPKGAGSAAAVPLPVGGVADGVAAEHYAAFGTERDGACWSPGHLTRGLDWSVCVDFAQPVLARTRHRSSSHANTRSSP